MSIQEMKRALQAKARELAVPSGSREDIAIEQSPEVIDGIQRVIERELALDSMSRSWKTARMVDDALARIDDGTYGACQQCEEPISERRLKAIPWAKYCLACQEKADRKDAAHVEINPLAA